MKPLTACARSAHRQDCQKLSSTNAAASRKDAKKKANRIAALRSRHKKHWEQEINKLNGKKWFPPERVRWCINPVTLVKKMNKQIQWENVVQLSWSGTVKFYGNSPKPMERAVIIRPPNSFDKPYAPWRLIHCIVML